MVDDYLSDREQEEALRNWWRENWNWILGGVVLGLALLAGWQYWKIHTTNRGEEAAELFAEYQAAGTDAEKAKAPLDRLTSDFASSPYTQQARLAQAQKHVVASQLDEAATQLRAVIDASKDEELAHIARLRLARVLIQQGKHDEALNLLKPETAPTILAREDKRQTVAEPTGKPCRQSAVTARPRKRQKQLKGSVEGKRRDE